MTRRFKPPIYASGSGADRFWMLNLDDDEIALVGRLLAELRGVVESADGHPEHMSPVAGGLFPNAYTDDPEKEAEYQRLMREELVASRVHQIETATALLGVEGHDVVEVDAKGGRRLDEGQVIALLQSVNAVRIVLGTVLDITDDGDGSRIGDIDEDDPMAGEHHLYSYLSWLLEWIVTSLQSTVEP